MQRSELLHLARVGAEKRLQAIKDEMDSIFRHFPELRRGRATVSPTATSANGTAATGATRKMSAAARKRISDAQKKRWKAWRRTRSA